MIATSTNAFLGYHFSAVGLTVAKQAITNTAAFRIVRPGYFCRNRLA